MRKTRFLAILATGERISGELASELGISSQPIPGFSEDFDYDPIGNRRSSATYNEKGEAQTSTYQANNLNQYTSRTTPGYAAVRGEADPNATVTVNENPAFRLGSYYFGSDLFDNSSSGGLATLETYATLSQTAANGDESEDLVSAITNQVYLAQSPETFAYDDDGNQTLITTKTGLWRVTYNGENRPILWVRESDNTTIVMSYDHMGRRREKNAQRFFYDGYLQVCSYSSPTPTLNSNCYIWDPTENVATRPLVWQTNDSDHFYAHDGNKNVSEVIASNNSIAAHYEYVSFGAVTVSRGTSAAVNPWRFSSEFTEDDSATMYYNYRHSESVTGRWISQDPAEEEGGIGLYVFAGNRPVLDNDSCGLKWNISRKGALFAEAYVDSEGDTFNDLASLVKLDVEDVSKWAHTNESLPVVCKRYNIPNHVVFHFGAEKTGDTMFFSLFATLRRHRQDEVDAARKAGYKVSVLNNVNAQQISTALSSDGLYKYTFVGHGEYGSFINTYPNKEGLTVEPGRYTIYGISLLQLFSCNSADNDIRRRHTVGIKAKRVIKVWSSNVARAGWFIGYSGSPTALTEVFSWTPIRGTNGK